MLKRIVIYGLGTFFSKILVFFMIPVYTRVFPAADYGYYDVAIQNTQMVISISFMEIWSGILRYIFQEKDKASPVNTFLRLLPMFFCFYLVAFFVLGKIMDIKYPVLTLIYGLTYLFYSISNSICRGYEKNWSYVVAGTASTVVSCGLSILFAVFLKKGIAYLILSQCIGYAVAVLYVEWKTKCYYAAIFKTRCHVAVKEMVTYCMPLMLNAFSFLFFDIYNKNVLIRTCGETVSGYYAYVSKYAAVLSVLISIYSLAWQEQAFLVAGNKNKNEVYSYYLNSFFQLVGLGIPIFIFVLYWLSPVIGGNQYKDAAKYIPFIVYVAFFSGISGILGTMNAVYKKTDQILISTIAGAAVNVCIASIFIRRFGIYALSIALCAGYVIMSLLRYWFAASEVKLDINKKVVGCIVIEMFVVLIAVRFLGKAEMVAISVVVFLLWAIFNKSKIAEAACYLKNIIGKVG